MKIVMTQEAIEGMFEWLQQMGKQSLTRYNKCDRQKFPRSSGIHEGRMSGYTLVREVLTDALEFGEKTPLGVEVELPEDDGV